MAHQLTGVWQFLLENFFSGLSVVSQLATGLPEATTPLIYLAARMALNPSQTLL